MFNCMRITLQHERHRSMIEALASTGSRPQTIPVTCRQALEWATINGAKMVGLDHRIGSLAPGKQADILVLRAGDLNIAPARDPIAAAVMHGSITNVDTVLIAGRVMKRNGRLLYPRVEERQQALAASGERILAEFERLPRRAA
jgi:cytosine/adenosine deaminase-related metal-dependent hydrolase